MPPSNKGKTNCWAHVMLRSLSVKMGESVHDGPGTSITNAALCAAMQRVLSKSRCNFMMACLCLFHVTHVARMQTTNWALSCKMQVLPVGFFLLAQRDQRNPSSEEDNLHNTSVRKTCTVEASIHPCKSEANRQELESLSILWGQKICPSILLISTHHYQYALNGMKIPRVMRQN